MIYPQVLKDKVYCNEFKSHRDFVIDRFKQKGINSGVLVLKSWKELEEPHSGTELPFNQEPNFFWFTGWEKPNSAITIDLETLETVLYVPECDERYIIWIGEVQSNESIILQTGVDKVSYINDLPKALALYSTVYCDALQFKGKAEYERTALTAACFNARIVKTPKEIEWITTASLITSNAVVNVMKVVKPGMYESDVENEFLYHGTRLGGRNTSFKTIAASGKNAPHLHYTANNDILKDGDLILLDCGMCYNHYAGDVTRTFPVNGKFSDEQRKVYDALLSLQKHLCGIPKPGITLNDLTTTMQEDFHEKVLLKLGLVKEGTEYSKDVVTKFLPHSLSHHLGVNVHDTVHFKSPVMEYEFSTSRVLSPGCVITIEPGIYFNRVTFDKIKSDPEMREKFSMMNYELIDLYIEKIGGIRIEDDLLITESGNRMLSNCPKEIDEIEALMAKV